jgi:hypothetical protein
MSPVRNQSFSSFADEIANEQRASKMLGARNKTVKENILYRNIVCKRNRNALCKLIISDS